MTDRPHVEQYESTHRIADDTTVYFNSQHHKTMRDAPSLPQNIGNWERVGSMVIGMAALFLLSQRLLKYSLLAALSVYLLYRGLTGYCYLYDRIDVNTRMGIRRATKDESPGQGTPEEWMEHAHDRVDEASMESFPASDPPGYD